MSRNLNGIPALNYIGVPQSAAVNAIPRPQEVVRAAPLFIDWNIYWQQLGHPAALSVAFNLDAITNVNALPAIRSVYIDNTNSAVPIYVTFPDTNWQVSAAPFTTVNLPVFTNGLKGLITAIGLTAGAIPQTRVQFSNQIISPFSDAEVQTVFPQYLGSPSIQRANALTPGFGPPALGDQLFSQILNCASPADRTAILGSPYPSGFLYLTSIYITAAFALNTSQTVQTVNITSSTGDVLWQLEFPVLDGNTQPPPFYVLLSQGSMNVRLDATQTFFYAPGNTVSSCSCNISIAYTYVP